MRRGAGKAMSCPSWNTGTMKATIGAVAGARIGIIVHNHVTRFQRVAALLQEAQNPTHITPESAPIAVA